MPTDYRRLAPDPRLGDIVEHYWVVRAPPPSSPARGVLVPTGRGTVQRCLADPGTRITLDGTRSVNADVLLPVVVTPFVLEQVGASHYVGAQLTPWGARALWPAVGPDPVQLSRLGGQLPDRDRLGAEPGDELDRWFLGLRRGADEVPELLRSAIGSIDSDPTSITVSVLSRLVGTSASTLYRAFVGWVGLRPQEYIAVARHRAFTNALLVAAGGSSTAMLAAMSGYCDQSHAARDFRRLTGMTLTEFRRSYDGIARLMSASA